MQLLRRGRLEEQNAASEARTHRRAEAASEARTPRRAEEDASKSRRDASKSIMVTLLSRFTLAAAILVLWDLNGKVFAFLQLPSTI